MKRCKLGYIVTLDVDAAWRRRGVARELMLAMEQQAAEAGSIAMGLHVFTGNDAAIAFYERAGYERVGEAANFYGAGVNGWVYRKGLNT